MVFEDVPHHEDAPGGLGQLDQVRPLRIGQRQRLFHQDVFPGSERLLHERVVGLGGRGDDDTRHRGRQGGLDRRDYGRLGGEGVRRPLSR